jgi:GST-like protein
VADVSDGWYRSDDGTGQCVLSLLPGEIQSVIDRYQGESKRLFRVLDTQLKDHEFLAGDYSIADIANWAWVRTHRWSGVDIDDLPHLKRWRDQIRARPAVHRGIERPVSSLDARVDDPDKARAFVENARKMLEQGQSITQGVSQ